jgi:hypothetical protein
MWAAYWREPGSIAVLLKHGANRRARDKQGRTALAIARDRPFGDTEAVELLEK